MMVHIPDVLTAAEVAQCREVMRRADWVDGRVTAGHQSAKVKHNLQLPERSPEALDLGNVVRAALGRNAMFMTAVLPRQVFPPLFNRYDADGAMTFGAHVDNAIRAMPGGGGYVRTDVSSTLFISAPEDYDGGELVVEDTYGEHAVKLPAGHNDRLSGRQRAPRQPGDARLAHRLVLLDPEHGARRHAAPPPVRSRPVDHAAHRRPSRASLAGDADVALPQPSAAVGRAVGRCLSVASPPARERARFPSTTIGS
jgi:hypothetical protein